eukprot:NODE_2586_length_1385_cov_149.863708_g2458_i0.p1 GENE.NODE_2586_length_1385_cov_149.863708_g2458_i0~~NODE_2586_length_1385_cov_149.863708_g2458_i0.p1  ORF type:complete len:423 (-),score=59.76 NODE_2586_length_1385_cov_149.863708_g2458_i0:117-1328(-)
MRAAVARVGLRVSAGSLRLQWRSAATLDEIRTQHRSGITFDQEPTVRCYLWRAQRYLFAASELARRADWIIGDEFKRVPVDQIERLIFDCQALLDANPQRKEDLPQSWTGSFPTISHAYQHSLFNWHCSTFFPMHAYLSPLEKHYFQVAFAAWADDEFRYPWGPNIDWSALPYKFGSFSYGHRVKGATLNSTRIGLGSGTRPESPEVVAAALALMHDWGAQHALELLAQYPDLLTVHCLGWDIMESEVKVYLRILDVARLPPALHSLVPNSWGNPTSDASIKVGDVRPEGIVSFTYKLDSKTGKRFMSESKVYVYPYPERLDHLGLTIPFESHDAALMFTSVRGLVPQLDVNQEEEYPHHVLGVDEKLNQIGRWVYDKYIEVGLTADTVQWDSRDSHCMYYPA